MNFDEFARRFGRIASELQSAKGDWLIETAKRLEGSMKVRIFNEGQNTAEGPIGKYKSRYWIKKREGRYQTSYVDLEFTGDLRRSIKPLMDGDDAVLAIVDDLDYKKAMGQEEIQGKKKGGNKMEIFTPSDSEIADAQENLDELVERELERIIARL